MSLLAPTSTHCSGILPPRARQRWNYSKRDQARHESDAESNSCGPESLPPMWRGELPGIAKAPSSCTPCYLSAPAPAEPNDPLWSTTHPVSLLAPGIACTRKRRSRRVSVRCFFVLGRTQLRVGPSRLRGERDLAYRWPPSSAQHRANGRSPAPTELLRVTHGYRREDLTMEGGTPPRRPQVTRPTGGGLTHTGGFSNA
jgi:hypothetical protein